MNHPNFEPGLPATEPVTTGPIESGRAIGADGASAAWTRATGQARLTRVGLLGIGAAAMIAAVILAFGSGAGPAGTLAAGGAGSAGSAGAGSASTGGTANGSTANGSTTNGSSGTVEDLHGGPDGRGGFGFGHGGVTITAISGSSISLATDDGWTRTITVDSGTTYAKAGATITLGDLAVGDTIGFRQTQESGGTWTIDSIEVVLPHLGGQVTAVDGSTITLQQRDGGTATVRIASGATITVNGTAATAADIKVGMVLIAEGTKRSDGSLDATQVRAGDMGSFRGNGRDHDNDGPGAPNPDASAAPSATSSAS